MATQRQRIKDHIANRLRGKQRAQVTLQSIDAAWASAPQPLRAQLLVGFKQHDSMQIGNVMRRILEIWLAEEAEIEAEKIIADDQISFDELEQINGPF